jgi:hypothetical protein
MAQTAATIDAAELARARARKSLDLGASTTSIAEALQILLKALQS